MLGAPTFNGKPSCPNALIKTKRNTDFAFEVILRSSRSNFLAERFVFDSEVLEAGVIKTQPARSSSIRANEQE